MARVKIYLDKGETKEEAELRLLKALELSTSGDLIQTDYGDPALQDVFDKLQKDHEEMYEQLLQDIFQELEKEYE